MLELVEAIILISEAEIGDDEKRKKEAKEIMQDAGIGEESIEKLCKIFRCGFYLGCKKDLPLPIVEHICNGEINDSLYS